MYALEHNNAGTMSDPTKDQKVIGCKWVYTIKYKPNEDVDSYISKFVAKGFIEKFGIDNFETFSPVAKTNTIKIIIAQETSKGSNLYQYDVKNTFLHGKLDQTIFMSLTLRYESKFKAIKLVKLKKPFMV